MSGIPLPDSEDRWKLAMEAIKGVWASKYNDRAYFSLRKVSLQSGRRCKVCDE
jgi:alpha-glucan,water dikinase